MDATWTDITATVQAVAKELPLGEMIFAPGYSLFEAMNAIEIMDPKMDAGMSAPPRTLDSLLDADALPLSPAPRELIGIMDGLLVNLVAWTHGHMLAQTVFSCLYLHRRHLVESPILSAFAAAYLKTCDLIRIAVLRADVHHEEDFIAMTSGFDMAASLSHDDALAALAAVEDQLELMSRRARGKLTPDVEDRCPPPFFELPEHAKEELDHVRAIHARVRFCHWFYMVHHSLEREGGRGVPVAKKAIHTALESIAGMRRSYELGEAPEFAFDPFVNAEMMGPTLPRPLLLPSFAEALDELAAILRALEETCVLCDLSTIPDLKHFYDTKGSRFPNIVNRAHVGLMGLRNRRVHCGRTELRKLTLAHIRLFGIGPKMCEEPYITALLRTVEEQIGQMFKHRCYNRPRQRRKLGRCFDRWAAIQQETAMVDGLLFKIPQEGGQIRDGPFMVWVLDHVLPAMVDFLLLGFELDMYEPFEFASIYWYLEITCAALSHNFVAATQYGEATAEKPAPAPAAKQGKAKKGAKAKKIEPPLPVAQWLYVRFLQNEMVRLMCGAMHRMIAAMESRGVLRFKSPALAKPEIVYRQRFAPFETLGRPSYFPYEIFERSSNVEDETDLFRLAHESFERVGIVADRLLAAVPASQHAVRSNAETMAAVAKANMSAIAQHGGTRVPPAADEPAANDVEAQIHYKPVSLLTLSFGRHAHFPVVAQ